MAKQKPTEKTLKELSYSVLSYALKSYKALE